MVSPQKAGGGRGYALLRPAPAMLAFFGLQVSLWNCEQTSLSWENSGLDFGWEEVPPIG